MKFCLVTIVVRMNAETNRMPRIAVEIKDDAGIAMIKEWIEELAAAP